MFSKTKTIPRGVAALTAALLLTVTGCSGEDRHDPPPPPPRWQLDHLTASRDSAVTDIAAAGRDEGWALRTEVPDDAPTEYVLLRRRGADWRQAEMPLRPLKDAVFANVHLEASAPDNVWLFALQLGDGDYEEAAKPTAVRWDGRAWRGTSVDFGVSDVVVLAADDVWVAPSDRAADLLHWDGARWSEQDLPIDDVQALGGTGPDDVWAVGYTDDRPTALHFDGKKWRSLPTPPMSRPEPSPENEDTALNDVIAVSPDEMWAFGYHRWTDAREQDHETSLALRWDGERWHRAPASLVTALGGKPELNSAGAPDGRGGFVLGGLHRTADGTEQPIRLPGPVAGRSGKITASDRRQEYSFDELELVPGTREIWAAGSVDVDGPADDSNFMRGVIASYTIGG
ncbi:hypothetical protein [Streptomyces sp. YU58]|uniref:hypothetical protein n=1 Tax=Streptomyces sp. SX92 TaxID=3158972 RepID=UPI0027B8B152|nr:hypothetical protein [Streptomyces coralus]WLW55108.1 hypothetical protein QU709_28870 [Streptomyces coralus]